jgi:myosin-5
LFNIKARHVLALPYTRTGDIVIAVNPYQWLTHLYEEKVQLLYAKKLVWDNSDKDMRKELEPHVYEISALAYKGLALNGQNQSLLVSGESGAGKTETVKICMNHMASLQRGPVEDGGSSEATPLNPVVQRVVDSNPLLEAFGNAKTSRNDNSSRFGKYIQLQFDRDTNVPLGQVPPTNLAGNTAEVYLLEKSRITTHLPTEGTYHIFYQLTAAKDVDKAEIWSGLKGKVNDDFKNIGEPLEKRMIDKMPDGDHYYETLKALALVNCTGDKLMTLMRAITTVLQLGNITFGPVDGDHERSCVTSAAEFTALSDLIGISEKDMEDALTERTMTTRGEVFKVPLTPDAAKDSCDAFAKEIYSKVFLWLVRTINAATCAEDNYDGERKSDFGTIGLLDIFGFESFAVNGFEQLCINYANEKLQQKFTKDIFATVMEEYKFEGIALDDIKYDDNSDVLELIESRTGLLAMLNEECMRPKGSDKEFVYKAIAANKKTPCLIADKVMGPLDFGIHHYAGKVLYFAQGFLSRNQDTLAGDLLTTAKKSCNDIIANHLENEAMMVGSSAPKPEVSKGPPKRAKSGISADSLWTKFRNQLNSLMKNLSVTQSRYIRCIKPNTVKKPCIMFHMTTVEQLRCAGVVAAVTISRSAFPNRLDHRSCIQRFKVLAKKSKEEKDAEKLDPQGELDPKDEVVKILSGPLEPMMEDGKPAFVIGKTRVYFRLGALEFLEALRMQGWDQWAVDIQRCVRGMITRNRLFEMYGAAEREEKERKEAAEAAEREMKEAAEAAEREIKEAAEAIEREAKEAAEAIKREAREAIEQAKEAAERAAAERELKRNQERKKYGDELAMLEKKVAEAKAARKKELADIAEERAILEADIAELKEQTSDAAKKSMKEPKKIAAAQKKKLDEQAKMIDFLKKENKKIRKENDKIKEKFGGVKTKNDKLIKVSEDAGGGFEDAGAISVSEKNENLINTLEQARTNNERLKQETTQRQSDYMTQAETRLEYQKTMARIVIMIQDSSKEPQVIEDTFCIALECEAESKSVMAAIEELSDSESDSDEE